MRRMLKALGVVAVIVFASSAVAAAGASAASFEANQTGTLSGHGTTPQVFTTGAGEIRCTTATASGNVEALSSETLKVTIGYSGCTAFGSVPATVSSAEYLLHANGLEDVLNTITFSVPFAGCSITVGPQTGRGTVSYSSSGGRLIATSGISGVTYTTSGGLCGSSGSNGTAGGAGEFALNGGAGMLAFNLGGVLRREAVQGGKVVEPCVFNKVGDKCTVNFIQEGEANEDKVEKAELKGAEAAARYKNVKAGCTAGKVLKGKEQCSDEIELIKVAAKTENEWCVIWDLGALTEVPFCVGLKQP
jgi:hypothetical protein